jgi:hypothetical protein
LPAGRQVLIINVNLFTLVAYNNINIKRWQQFKSSRMKILLLTAALLISYNSFCQRTTVQDSLPIVRWDSSKTTLQYQFEDSIMRRAIIGSWKDQNSISHILKNGKIEIKYLDNNTFEDGKWSIANGILILKFKYFSYSSGNGAEKKWDEVKYKILEFSQTQFKIQALNHNDKTIWIANKLSKWM